MDVVRNPVPQADTARIEDFEQVARYLSAAPGVLAAPMMVFDKLDPSAPPIGGVVWQTDGEFVWPGELSYYTEKYAAAPPEALLQRIRNLNYECPPVPAPLLRQAGNALRTYRPLPEGAEVDTDPSARSLNPFSQ